MKYENIRNSNIEVLRLVLMMAIFGWHILCMDMALKITEKTYSCPIYM